MMDSYYLIPFSVKLLLFIAEHFLIPLDSFIYFSILYNKFNQAGSQIGNLTSLNCRTVIVNYNPGPATYFHGDYYLLFLI